MANTTDDLDALFDEVSSQRSDNPAVISDDNFDTLFDQTAAQFEIQKSTPSSESTAEHDHAQSEKPMFDRLGGIVRMLHDSLRELGYDKGLTEASSQIGDAQDRLEYIATLTEQAANNVLNTIDEGMPAQDALAKRARNIEVRWGSLFAGDLSVEQFKSLAADAQQFAADVASESEAEKARLLAIMMAQDFQDITGQLIKKVITVTKAVEKELAQVLRDNAPAAVREKLLAPAPAEAKAVDLMSGPAAPTIALDQDSVDDLLADLGF